LGVFGGPCCHAAAGLHGTAGCCHAAAGRVDSNRCKNTAVRGGTPRGHPSCARPVGASAGIILRPTAAKQQAAKEASNNVHQRPANHRAAACSQNCAHICDQDCPNPTICDHVNKEGCTQRQRQRSCAQGHTGDGVSFAVCPLIRRAAHRCRTCTCTCTCCAVSASVQGTLPSCVCEHCGGHCRHALRPSVSWTPLIRECFQQHMGRTWTAPAQCPCCTAEARNCTYSYSWYCHSRPLDRQIATKRPVPQRNGGGGSCFVGGGVRTG
jgi:hypothetical protein